jgi:hypothetical protein
LLLGIEDQQNLQHLVLLLHNVLLALIPLRHQFFGLKPLGLKSLLAFLPVA